MKKANVNLFDKNKVQVKLLKNKNLRISDGRKNPTKIVNLRKTGITLWTDGNHLKIFRGNLLKEVIGRSVYRANKLETVEFVSKSSTLKRSKIKNSTLSFIGIDNVQEGLIIGGTNSQGFIGIDNVQEGRSIRGTKSQNFIGIDNVQEGLTIGGNDSQEFIGIDNVQEGRSAGDNDVLIIAAKSTSEARTLAGTYAVYMSLNEKSITVRHGQIR